MNQLIFLIIVQKVKGRNVFINKCPNVLKTLAPTPNEEIIHYGNTFFFVETALQ